MIEWSAPPWILAVSMIALVVMLVVSVITWVRLEKSFAVLVIEGLRVLIAAMAILTMWQLSWTWEESFGELPTVVVVGDETRSMETRDLGGEDDEITESRGEWLRNAIIEPFWDDWQDRYDFKYIPLRPTSKGGTALGDGVRRVAEEEESMDAMIILSDGDWNQGVSPVDVAEALRDRGVPLSTVVVGKDVGLPDLEMMEIDLPLFAMTGQAIEVGYRLRSAFADPLQTTVRLEVGDETFEKEVDLAAGEEFEDSFMWTPQDTGEMSVRVSTPVREGEIDETNNDQRSRIDVRDDKVKVLLVDSLPRWEYRFLRNALMRDPGVELETILYQDGIEKGGGTGYRETFPETEGELASFDVVFLGDVGSDQLGTLELENLRDLVKLQAGGLVLVPGRRGNQLSLFETPLEELIPVLMDDTRTEGESADYPSSLVLTPEGEMNRLTLLTDDEEQNEAIWESLPGFYWYAPVIKAKVGANVLASHQAARNELGRIPLLVTRPAGHGKVLFLGTEHAWRWRRGVEDRYHYRFWSQVVRWMSYQRNLSAGERVRLMFSSERPTVGRTLMVRAVVLDEDLNPFDGDYVRIRLTDTEGAVYEQRLSGDEGGWGLFSGEITPELAGTYEVEILDNGAEPAYETSINVLPSVVEKVGRAARSEVLREMADITGGIHVSWGEVERVLEGLERLPKPEVTFRRTRIWAHPIWVASLVVLASLFWFLRKRRGLL